MQEKKTIVSLTGNLEFFNIYDILMLLHLGRKTGVLFIEHQKEKRQIFLHQGIIVFALSSDYRDSLAKFMIENSYITNKQLNDGYQTMKEYPKKYKSPWDILVEREVLKEKDLKRAAEFNTSQTIYSVFRWKKGTFQFSHFGRLPEHAIIVNIDPQSLIMEGVRMSDEWEEIHKDSPQEDIVLQVNPDIDPNNKKIDLTNLEWKVLSKVNGHRTVIDICKEIKYLNEYETLKILTGLYKKNIILPTSKDQEREDPGETSSSNINIFSLETLDSDSFQTKDASGLAERKEPSLSKKSPPSDHSIIRGKIVITEKGIKTGTMIISSEPLVIGSGSDCDVPIKSKSANVPMKFATIYLEGMNYIIRAHTDREILINNVEYHEKELERFDEIQIGEISLIFS